MEQFSITEEWLRYLAKLSRFDSGPKLTQLTHRERGILAYVR